MLWDSTFFYNRMLLVPRVDLKSDPQVHFFIGHLDPHLPRRWLKNILTRRKPRYRPSSKTHREILVHSWNDNQTA